jgi:hypothetical protein
VTAARARALLAGLAIVVLAVATFAYGGRTTAATASVTVDAANGIGTFNTQLDTQIHYPGMLEAAGSRPLFRALSPPLVRILASSDGCCWAGGPAPMIPAGKEKGSWDFSSLDSVTNNIVAAGAAPVLDIFQAPEWMWDCTTGKIRDGTFNDFGDYMARLVGYYNKGSFVAEDGHTITNPAGTANRIVYWELWNEPDLWSIACEPNGNENITAAQYVTMWNATVSKMLAVDPSIKFIGPVASPQGNGTGNYFTSLLAGATRKPDVLSFHGYGGWLTTQGDQEIFDSIDTLVALLGQVRSWAPDIPVWITELNVNAAWGDDPTHRPYNAYGAAWGASAFRRLALGGAAALFQYEFAHPSNSNFQMVDPATGQPRLPYWRDYYLARYFPPGSMLLGSSSSVGGVETLAARAPGSSNVHVLIVNRQVDTSAPVGGAGLPATVQVNVANLSGVTEVSLRQLDGATSIVNGPPAIALPTGSRATVTFSGYGAALLDFVTSSPSIAAPPSLPLPPVPATGVFTDDFESGLAAWLVSGTGTAAVQQTVVHAGASALALSNASGQAVAVQKDLGRPVSSSASTFYLRPTSTTAGVIASGLDATKTKVRWALSYAYGSLRAQLLDDTGAVTDRRRRGVARQWRLQGIGGRQLRGSEPIPSPATEQPDRREQRVLRRRRRPGCDLRRRLRVGPLGLDPHRNGDGDDTDRGRAQRNRRARAQQRGWPVRLAGDGSGAGPDDERHELLPAPDERDRRVRGVGPRWIELETALGSPLQSDQPRPHLHGV